MDAELINYMASLMPTASIQCAECSKGISISVAIIREEKFFCRQECADRNCAVLVRISAKSKPVPGCESWGDQL